MATRRQKRQIPEYCLAKVAIIADRQTVEQGSFNYSDAAAHKNSENVLVNWGNPKLAEVYLRHFERNYGQATVYREGY